MPRHLIPSDTSIRSIKPGDQRNRISDGDGLYLRLFVNGGSHGWRFDYTIHGRRKTLSLGTYPDTGLSAARVRADEARRSVSQGADPSDLRKAQKATATRHRDAQRLADAGLPPADSLEAVARDWLVRVHSAKVSPAQVARILMRLERGVFPWLGTRPLASIKAPELLDCLRRIEGRGAIETARRVKHACGQVFRFGIATGRCERDIAADLRDALTPVQVTHRAAIIDPVRAGDLLRAIDSYQGLGVVRAALRLAPLVFQRPGEIRHAEWSEFDLDSGEWWIPSARMKRTKQGKANGQPHLVPLSTQAVSVLRDLKPMTGQGRFVFPNGRGASRAMSDAAVLAALRRMGYPKDEMSGHGFRAMARTMIAERLGIEDGIIEAQLAHSVRDANGRAYNRTSYVEQRRQMMQLWADYLDTLRAAPGATPRVS